MLCACGGVAHRRHMASRAFPYELVFNCSLVSREASFARLQLWLHGDGPAATTGLGAAGGGVGTLGFRLGGGLTGPATSVGMGEGLQESSSSCNA